MAGMDPSNATGLVQGSTDPLFWNNFLDVRLYDEQWTLPSMFLEMHAEYFRKQIGTEIELPPHTTVRGFQLFIEFIFTGSWRVDEEFATEDAWRACGTGTTLKAPGFHDLGMKQVFETFCIRRTKLSASSAMYACEIGGPKVVLFVQDLVIRNWNQDMGIIDSQDMEWLDFFEKYAKFRNKFITQVGISHKAKLKTKLNLQNYLMGTK